VVAYFFGSPCIQDLRAAQDKELWAASSSEHQWACPPPLDYQNHKQNLAWFMPNKLHIVCTSVGNGK